MPRANTWRYTPTPLAGFDLTGTGAAAASAAVTAARAGAAEPAAAATTSSDTPTKERP